MFRHRGQIYPTSSPIFLGSSDSEKETSERPYPNIGPSAWENAEERRDGCVGMFPPDDRIQRTHSFFSSQEDQPKSIYLKKENAAEEIYLSEKQHEISPTDSSSKRKITLNVWAPSNTPNPNSLVPSGRNQSQLSNLSLSLSPLPFQSSNAPCNSPMEPPRSFSSSFSGPEHPLSPVVFKQNPQIPCRPTTTIRVDSTETGSRIESSTEGQFSSESSRKSSIRSSSTCIPMLSVPTFESKDGLLSPVQVVLSPNNRNFTGSALSLRSSYSTHSIMSEASTIFGPEKEQVLTERMRIIVDSFQSRARRVKQRLEQPPTPTDDGSENEDDLVGPRRLLDDFADIKDSENSLMMGTGEKWRDLLRRIEFIDPRGHINIGNQKSI